MQLAVYIFACAAFLALQSVADGASIPLYEDGNDGDNEIDNSLEVNSGVRFEPVRPTWVKISKDLPPVVRRASGSKTELECAASGSPAPVIIWLRDNVPITESKDYENNLLIEGSDTGVVMARSRLLINNLVPVNKATYTCLARSGSKAAFTTTVIHTSNPGKSSNLSEYLLLSQDYQDTPSKPRIVSFYQTVVENSGSTLVLPCKITGYPRPEFYWMDSDDAVITSQDPRVKILKSGELVIQGLDWSDMGLYTCVARNTLGKDSISTFVYPTSN